MKYPKKYHDMWHMQICIQTIKIENHEISLFFSSHVKSMTYLFSDVLVWIWNSSESSQPRELRSIFSIWGLQRLPTPALPAAAPQSKAQKKPAAMRDPVLAFFAGSRWIKACFYSQTRFERRCLKRVARAKNPGVTWVHSTWPSHFFSRPPKTERPRLRPHSVVGHESRHVGISFGPHGCPQLQ